MHDRISGRLARFIAETGPRIVGDGRALDCAHLADVRGDDRLINPAGSARFAAAAPAAVVTAKCFDALYHEIFNELDAEAVFAELKSWLDARF